jgi:riboflavin transporter FmnP
MKNPLKKLFRAKRGMVNVIIGAVLALVIGGILLMIGVLIQANVHDAIPAVTGTANTTIENVNTAVYGGYQLMTVLPTVLAAGAIIAAIVGGLLYYRSKQ